MAVRSDLASAFRVTVAQVIIVSLTLGSLKVEFAVAGISAAEAEVRAASIASSPAATPLPMIKDLYSAANGGASTSVSSIVLGSVTASPAADGGGVSVGMGVGIALGVVVVVVVVAAIAVVVLRRRGSATSAQRDEEMRQTQPLEKVLLVEDPPREVRLTNVEL